MTPELVSHLPELEQALEDAERHTEALRQVVNGLRMLNGHSPEVVPAQRVGENGSGDSQTNGHQSMNGHNVPPPKGRAAVLAVMADRDGTWSTKQILRELRRRGWTVADDPVRTRNAMTAALYRMVQAGEVARVRPGVYRVPPATLGIGDAA